MITNDRQYKITRAAVARFEKAIAAIAESGAARRDVHPRLLQAEREGLESQAADLREQVREYEELRSGLHSSISVASFDELPEGLIKARIATGLTQKDLADRLGMKEQQIQRYEAERYASASLQRLQDVARALGIRIEKNILLPLQPNTFESLMAKLKQVGIDWLFVRSRLLPPGDSARASDTPLENEGEKLATKTAAAVSRIFGWPADALLGMAPLALPRYAAAEARFKMPAGRSRQATNVFVTYANYLAVTVLTACRSLPKTPIPEDPHDVYRAALDDRGELTLLGTLHFVWNLGVPVLPLRGQGAFHGACWRYDGDNVIVLKQSSKYESRWLFDLLHELKHASQSPELSSFEVVEADETSMERRNSPDEIAATIFAADVILNGRAEVLAKACVAAAGGSVARLKNSVAKVAAREHVNVGALANYLAFRLSWQDINWWGAAANLQSDGDDPFEVTRRVFFERFPFDLENDLDRRLLERALQ